MKCRQIAILIFLFVTAFFACKVQDETEEDIPSNVLSIDRFSKILADMALAESAANMNIKSVPVTRIDTVYAFDPLRENGIDAQLYDSTLAFYTRHPKLYKLAYEQALVILSELESKRAAAKKDSTAR